MSKPDTHRSIDLAGTPVPLTVRRNGRAKRTSLRLDPKQGGFVLVLPRRASLKDGLAFAESNRSWMAARLKEMPERVTFADGVNVPFRGRAHVIRHCPESRGTVWLDGADIKVAGAPEHLPRRLTDWLRRTAKADLGAVAHRHADQLGLQIKSIAVRDTRSRWGSCSADGRLSFCWRLILAPEWVADYVAAHEVAHIAELNHAPRFWRLVDGLCPHRRAAETWLRRHGPNLHLIG